MATSTKKAASKKAGSKAAADETKEEAGKASVATDAEANPMSDPTSHAVSASEMAELRPGTEKGKALAAADAGTAERLEAETKETAEARDNSVAGRLARSGLVLNEPQGSSDRWVGESIQKTTDPARLHLKTNCRVTPISDVNPWTGLRVEPIGGGEPFTVPEELGGKDATPANWLALTNPATGKSLISE